MKTTNLTFASLLIVALSGPLANAGGTNAGGAEGGGWCQGVNCTEPKEGPPEPSSTPMPTSSAPPSNSGPPPAQLPAPVSGGGSEPPPAAPPAPRVAPPPSDLGKTCPPNASDCDRDCTSNTSCGDPFALVELSAAASGSDLLKNSKANTDNARKYLSRAQPAHGNGSGDGNGSSSGTGGGFEVSGLHTEPAGISTAAIKKDGSLTGDAGNGVYTSGSGSDSKSGGGGPETALDGSQVARELLFGEKTNAQATEETDSERAEAAARAAHGGLDPDNSDSWTEEQKAERRRAAMETDSDSYFKLITGTESLFKRVHERYQKVQKRQQVPTKAPSPIQP